MKRLIVALMGVACFGFGQTVLAEGYAVSYTQSELASVQGARDVHERIVKAAKRYCPEYSVVKDLREVNACVADVVKDLVAKVDHPRLYSYHEGDDNVRVASASRRGASRS